MARYFSIRLHRKLIRAPDSSKKSVAAGALDYDSVNLQKFFAKTTFAEKNCVGLGKFGGRSFGRFIKKGPKRGRTFLGLIFHKIT
jgi:hypothetical protein